MAEFSEEKMVEEFNRKAVGWDLKTERVKRVGQIARAMLGQVSFSQDMVALEYGCGTGLLGFSLQPYVKTMVMADNSQGMLEVLGEKIRAAGVTNMEVRYLDLSSGEVPDEKFDLICSCMVLHHIRNIDEVLSAWVEMLKSEGVLLIADLDEEDGSFHQDGHTIHNGINRAWLCGELEKKGLVRVKNSTAMVIDKEIEGEGRGFPVFLISAEKGANL